MNNWLYPFRGRNPSNAYGQNFLWAENNVYIMDNHRTALWCWSRHLQASKKYRVFHIDANYDSRTFNNQTLELITPINNLSLNEYLLFVANPNIEQTPTLTWDNYISVFVAKYHNSITEFMTCTQKIGDSIKNLFPIIEIDIFSLPELVKESLLLHSNWIVNIDLDFFFARTGQNLEVYLSDSYIDSIFKTFKSALKKIKN